MYPHFDYGREMLAKALNATNLPTFLFSSRFLLENSAMRTYKLVGSGINKAEAC